LAAARAEFGASGYLGASVRSIARRAGVDPALVRHYFSGKSDLFTAALGLPVNPRVVAARVAEAPPDGLGEALVTAFLEVWDNPLGHQRLRALMSTAPVDPKAVRAFKQFVEHTVLRDVAERRGADDAQTRASLAATQLVGVMVGRAVLGVEPLASLSQREVIAWLAGPVGMVLTGPAPGHQDTSSSSDRG
jgi:AcrR family transcriptional regulator